MEHLTDFSGGDVTTYSLSELRQLASDVETAIAAQRGAAQERALEEIQRLMRDTELTPEMVLDRITVRRKPRRRLPPKYRDPDAPENTWAGRGKQPNWLTANLVAGAQLEDFLIDAPATAAADPGKTTGGADGLHAG